MTRYLSVAEVLHLHRELMLESRQAQVLIVRDKLESALLRPAAEGFGEEFYPDVAEKAAVLLQGIVIAHPFMDGNKRVAAAAMLAFLRLNGVDDSAAHDQLYDFVIAVTTGELREVQDIAAGVRRLFRLPDPHPSRE